uniref:Spinulosain HLmb n=1 Tax=Hydrophylax bahuvistara TaxID=1690667 RepID=A0A141PZI7_HYDBH|nr:Spinulosain HLmb [Hydrophylax bahuvistara]
MFTLKKLLLLILFLGIVSSSPCSRKRDADEEATEEEAKMEDIKRAMPWRPATGLLPIKPTYIKPLCGND